MFGQVRYFALKEVVTADSRALTHSSVNGAAVVAFLASAIVGQPATSFAPAVPE